MSVNQMPDIQSFFSMLDKHPDEVMLEIAYDNFRMQLLGANSKGNASFDSMKSSIDNFGSWIAYPRLREMYAEIAASHFSRVIEIHSAEAIADALAPYGFLLIDGKVQMPSLTGNTAPQISVITGPSKLWGVRMLSPYDGWRTNYCGEPIDQFFRTFFLKEQREIERMNKASKDAIKYARQDVIFAKKTHEAVAREADAFDGLVAKLWS